MHLRALLLLVAGCAPGWDPRPTRTFELVGRHEPLACEACHPAAQALGPLPTACASCHEDARPLDHYDGDCGICHTPYGWDDIVVDHGFFPLTDAHALECTACHESGYQGLDPSCASCHADDRPPDHFGAQDCGGCHVPTTWGDATFDHDDWFPVPHHGVADCEACHVVPDTYSTFSCVDCHEHSRAATNAEHDEVSGYSYDSAECLRCHPRGEGD